MNDPSPPRGTAAPDISTAELQLRVAALARANTQERQSLGQKDTQIAALRRKVAQAQQQVETEEEKIGNALFRRLDRMQRETQRMTATIRAEEEGHNKVLHDIADVRAAKVELESRIEAEHEYMVNELHRRLLALSRDIANLEGQLHAQRGEFLTDMHAAVERLANRGPADDAETDVGDCPVAVLEADLRRMLADARDSEAARFPIEEEAQRLEATLASERREAFLASARAAKLREELEQASTDLAFERQLDLKAQAPPPAHADPCAASAITAVTATASGNFRPTPRRAATPGHARAPSTGSAEGSVSSGHAASPAARVAHSAAQVRAHTAAVLSGAMTPTQSQSRSGSQAPRP